ncbi:MAG: hypothetical protein FWD18_02315 [Micrococcales bacterium]|nr:hypothetical protein [Micrococcales bacterium]
MTSVNLPDGLARQVEAATSQDLATFVEAAVRQMLTQRRVRDMEQGTRVEPVGAHGVLPEVDLSRWADFLATEGAEGALST